MDDTAQRASTIATDGTGQAHSIHVGNDVDWMQFTLDIRSQMIIESSKKATVDSWRANIEANALVSDAG